MLVVREYAERHRRAGGGSAEDVRNGIDADEPKTGQCERRFESVLLCYTSASGVPGVEGLRPPRYRAG